MKSFIADLLFAAKPPGLLSADCRHHSMKLGGAGSNRKATFYSEEVGGVHRASS